jgi:hypothetical protein
LVCALAKIQRRAEQSRQPGGDILFDGTHRATEVAKATITLVMAVGFLAGCGGGNGSTSPSAPVTIPPNAFSNANITGGYAWENSGGLYSSPTGPVALETVIGTFTADGKGNIVSGQETDANASYPSYPINSQNAYFTITGNYTVNPDGTGTVQLFLSCIAAPDPYPLGSPPPTNVTRCSIGASFTVISAMTITSNGDFTFSMLPYIGTVTLQITAKKQ